MNNSYRLSFILFFVLVLTHSCSNKKDNMAMDNLYPWCIVAFDSLERSPSERINMLKELGFEKYAYDWRDKHLDEMAEELTLAQENDIEIISVWLWLNAKRDSLGNLSPSNDRIFEILKDLKLKTTLWLSFSNNFFEGQTQAESVARATEMIKFVYHKAEEIGCTVTLYNHGGWFGNLDNQIEIINAMPQYKLRIVYNFHHAHQYVAEFPKIVEKIKPYLASVNLNGMRADGPKILPIGDGNLEKDMIKTLTNQGFTGPWGILGHVEELDVKKVLRQNINGLKALEKNRTERD